MSAALPIRAYHHARRRLQELPLLWRAHRILRRYSTHYEEARRLYRAHQSGTVAPRGLADLGVCVLGEAGSPPLQLPDNFSAIVDMAAASVSRALDDGSPCEYFPPVPASQSPAEAVQRGDVISIAVRDPFVLDGIRPMASALVPQIERHIYGSYVIVDK
ncbi:MAG TPA: hypothetical protein VEA16_00500, partial [Vicinamibacterales bacterium]|nr:hypothetical protein [Vicinamibacterales bacterium]